METWKKIPGYSNYMASDMGKIKTFNWKNQGITRIMMPAKDKSGYLRTMLKGDDGKFNTVKIHRIIALTFIENSENKPEVNHKNSIRIDNRVSNLEWVTKSENIKHSFKYGNSSNRGELNPAATITEKDVIEIRKNYKYGRKSRFEGGESKPELARKYNTTVAVIKMIIQRKTWKHII